MQIGYTCVYTEKNNIDGRKVVITRSEQINNIDDVIMNNLYYGLDIYILSTNHIRACEGNNALFNKLSHDNDPLVRVIFISDILKQEFKIMEDTYYTESRRGRNPCPRDPLDKFKWHCPVCQMEFDNMCVPV